MHSGFAASPHHTSKTFIFVKIENVTSEEIKAARDSFDPPSLAEQLFLQFLSALELHGNETFFFFENGGFSVFLIFIETTSFFGCLVMTKSVCGF